MCTTRGIELTTSPLLYIIKHGLHTLTGISVLVSSEGAVSGLAQLVGGGRVFHEVKR